MVIGGVVGNVTVFIKEGKIQAEKGNIGEYGRKE